MQHFVTPVTVAVIGAVALVVAAWWAGKGGSDSLQVSATNSVVPQNSPQSQNVSGSSNIQKAIQTDSTNSRVQIVSDSPYSRLQIVESSPNSTNINGDWIQRDRRLIQSVTLQSHVFDFYSPRSCRQWAEKEPWPSRICRVGF